MAADLVSAPGDHLTAACTAPLRSIWTFTLPTTLPATEALTQLGVKRLWGGQNLRVVGANGSVGAVLEVSYPAGSINPGNARAPAGGAGFLYGGPPDRRHDRTHACLSYDVRFAPDFDFARGGKLPGMYGGAAPSGGEDVAGQSGFSLRYMWRRAGRGEVYAYLAGQPNGQPNGQPSGQASGKYGQSIGRGTIQFVRGKWHRLEQDVVLNHIGTADGILRVWVDGALVIERRDIPYRREPSIGIEGLMFSTFFGGHDATWASPRDQKIQIGNITFLADDS